MKRIGLFLSCVFLVLSLSGCTTTMGRLQSPLTIVFKPEVTFWEDSNRYYPYWYGYYPSTYITQETLIYRTYSRPHYPRKRRW